MAFSRAGAGMSFMAAGAGSGLDQTSKTEREEQQKALEALLGVLLSAGYFRARIPQLTPFDKLVGGLCWCITSSGTAVDVDIFYDEDLALGQKIQLCEVIVTVLRRMGCPSPLQAHQIQGSDFLACFPVVQWLVKKVLEYRRITGDNVRMASQSSFDRQYAAGFRRESMVSSSVTNLLAALKAEQDAEEQAEAAGSAAAAASAAAVAAAAANKTAANQFLSLVEDRYKPQRRYRRAAAAWGVGAGLGAEARIQSCLLEYGERAAANALTDTGAEGGEGGEGGAAGGKGARTGTDFDRKYAQLQKAARAEQEEQRKQAVAREAALLQQMTEAKGSSGAVSGSSVGALMSLQTDELRRAAEEYSAKERELRALAESGDLLANTRVGRAAAHSRRVAALNTKLETAEASVKEQQAALAALEAEVAELREQLAQADKYNAKALAQIAKLDAQIEALSPEEKEQLKQLYNLKTRAEALVEREAGFKAQCRQHMQELQERLAALEAEGAAGEGSRRVAEAKAALAEMENRHSRARAVLAERTREVQRLARTIDEIPSQVELLQYQKRFQELYEQVAEKLDETRKYYCIYNTLEKKRGFMVKQESLLASMLENHHMLKIKTHKAAYLEQCGQIQTSVEDTVSKQCGTLEAKKAVRDSKAAELQRLVEQERAYYKVVKELQEEFQRSEKLQLALVGM